MSAGSDSAVAVQDIAALVKSPEITDELSGRTDTLSGDRRPARVFAGYVDRRRDDSVPARDAVVVRSAAEFPAIIGQWHLGDVGGCLFAGSDVDVTPYRWEPVEDGVAQDAGLVVGQVVTGAMRVTQDRRTVMLRSGQVAFYDGVTPCSLHSDGPHRYFVAHVRGRALRIRSEDRDALVARDLSAFTGTAALAALLAAVVDAAGEPTLRAGRHLGDAIVACVHAIVAEAHGTTVGGRSAVLFGELTDWLDAHLADRHLTAELLAAQHFLSARYVRKLFADHDTTVMGYIRLRRLERIRDELLQPSSADLPVSVVAARWGFKDPSVFSRAFTRRFGQGPQSFRKEAMGHARLPGPRA
jgi:AraC-like DNA-binding protein